MTPPLRITHHSPQDRLLAAYRDHNGVSIFPLGIEAGDILVVMAPEREILFDIHGTDIGYVETCLGPVEVVDVLSVGAVVLRPVWPGATEGDLDRMVGGEVRRFGH